MPDLKDFFFLAISDLQNQRVRTSKELKTRHIQILFKV